MNQLQTTGIILRRTDYGEADRIITLLTPDHGKLSLLAKGVRKIKSKLAGGIELFSVSDVTFIRGRGEIGTLVSTRLLKHYGHIVDNLDRTMLGYELIKQLNKTTEDQPEADYFHLLEQAFAALDDTSVDTELIKLWFLAQLLRIAGHTPNLQTDTAGSKLAPDANYDFSFEDMALTPHPEGRYQANDVKFLRLVFSGNAPTALQRVQGAPKLTKTCVPLAQTMAAQYLRL
jgi:DNA repair protein RecO (recombination protein O)